MSKNFLKSWLDDIRYSDEGTRKFWLYTLTSVSMVAVIALWVGYIGITTPDVAPNKKPVVQKSEPGTGEILNSGFQTVKSALGSSISRGIALVKDTVFKKENTITISNKNRNFTLENIEKVPLRNLPQ